MRGTAYAYCFPLASCSQHWDGASQPHSLVWLFSLSLLIQACRSICGHPAVAITMFHIFSFFNACGRKGIYIVVIRIIFALTNARFHPWFLIEALVDHSALSSFPEVMAVWAGLLTLAWRPTADDHKGECDSSVDVNPLEAL